MSAIQFCSTPEGDLLHYFFIFRNTKLLSTEIRNVACFRLGAILRLQIQKEKEVWGYQNFKKISDVLLACSAEKCDKTDIHLGSYGIRIFVFWTLLRILIPCLEILFCSNHYSLVCIFRALILSYKFLGTIFIHTIFASTSQKN